jgi:hypothetical protein
MQVVLSQRMTMPFEASPLSLYRALRSLNFAVGIFLAGLAGVLVGAVNELRKANAAPLGGLRGLTFPDADIRFAGKHVRPGALAGIADKSVSLHVAYDGMRCHRHMHHARSALRANRIGSDYIGR